MSFNDEDYKTLKEIAERLSMKVTRLAKARVMLLIREYRLKKEQGDEIV